MKARPIWQTPPDLAVLNDMLGASLSAALGMRIVASGDDWIEGEMPVDERTRQPLGLLHGGASVALAETLGSIGAHLCIDASRQMAVGLEINANHVRAVREGLVRGRAEPLHLGRSVHVWQVRISDEAGRLVSIARLTLTVIDAGRES